MSPGVLAGAALAGLLLVATPFALAKLSGGESPDHPTAAAQQGDAYVLQDDQKPGFVPVPAASSGGPRTNASATAGAGSNRGTEPGGVGRPGHESAPSDARTSPAGAPGGTQSGARAGTKSGTKSATVTATSTPSQSSGSRVSTVAAAPQPTAAAPQPAKVEVVSKLNSKCLDVTDYNYVPGNPVQMWTCRQQSNQYWQFYPDGTLRAGGLCMTSEWSSGASGSPIRLERCDNRPQQKWVLNGREDIVNPAADKCLDVVDVNRNSGARLQLWTCNGQAQQKWYKR